MAIRRRLILLLFFLSGTTGLVFEVLWSKSLAFVFGSSTRATAVVLASYMAGMALGSLLAGRWVGRWKRPVAAYGVIVALVGIWCMALPALLGLVRPVLASAYGTEGPTLTFALLRLLLVAALLLVPSTLMGMTFPVLGAHALSGDERPGRYLALLYGFNCLGAVAGALASSFVLVPALGLSGTTTAAGLLNLALGAAAWQAGRNESPPALRPARRRSAPPQPTPAADPALLGIFALSGLASMLFQVAWTRVFSLLFGSSVYVFSLVVAAFIGGLALGSLVISPRLDAIARPDRFMAWVVAGTALAGFAVTALLRWAPLACAHLYPEIAHLSFGAMCLVQFLLVGLLVLVPTTLMGLLMPVVSVSLGRGAADPGSVLGRVAGANMTGCIAGSLLAGFLLVPVVGLRATLLTASAVNGLLAVALWCRAEGTSPRRLLAGAAAVAALTLVTPSWDTALLTSAPYLYAARYGSAARESGASLETTIRSQGEIVFHEEGESCVVTVRRYGDGVRSLHVNGKADASTELDMATQLLVSHLPALCAGSLQDVLVVGLGGGASLGAFQAHPCGSIDCVEISPEMVRAAEFFRDATGHDLTDPRVRMVVDDGRTWLDLSGRTYDVIMSEPSNPWVAGMTALFTREFFELCRRRLKPGGVMSQWIHAYNMDSGDFKAVLATFRSVFPRTLLWRSGGRADCIMLGLTDSEPVDLDRFRERWARPAVAASLARVGLASPEAVLDHYLGGPGVVARLARGARRVTDDNLTLEYTAPRSLLAPAPDTVVAELAAAADPADLASVFRGEGVEAKVARFRDRRRAEELITAASACMDASDLDGALSAVAESYRLDPAPPTTREAYAALLGVLGRRAASMGHEEEARAFFVRQAELEAEGAADPRG